MVVLPHSSTRYEDRDVSQFSACPVYDRPAAASLFIPHCMILLQRTQIVWYGYICTHQCGLHRHYNEKAMYSRFHQGGGQGKLPSPPPSPPNN